MEIAAFIMSIIALIVSIVISFVEIRNSNKINKINLDSEYINEIFKNYLLIEIPQKRKFIKFDGKGKLTGISEIKQVLNNMLKDSLYFRFADKSFYDTLKTIISNLEDFLVEKNSKVFESTEHAELLSYIDKSIEDIYSTIEKKKIKG